MMYNSINTTSHLPSSLAKVSVMDITPPFDAL